MMSSGTKHKDEWTELCEVRFLNIVDLYLIRVLNISGPSVAA